MTSYGVQLPVLLEKAMATHSGALAWKIPWTEEPRRLQSVGSQRPRRDGVSSLSLCYRAAPLEVFATPQTAAPQTSLSITNSQSLLKPMSIEAVMPSNHRILCRPLLLPPSVFPSIRVFSKESVLLIRWPKDWSNACMLMSDSYVIPPPFPR